MLQIFIRRMLVSLLIAFQIFTGAANFPAAVGEEENNGGHPSVVKAYNYIDGDAEEADN